MGSPRNRRKRRRLGQHYLSDATVVDLMLQSANIQPTDRVLEIGTGRGMVTRRLCEVASQVEAFEVDAENYATTKNLGLSGLELHEEDAFFLPRTFDVLVSSLPYSESSNFVEWLAESRYRRAVVLLQRDFALKLLASVGDEQYRAVSVISQISSHVNIVNHVGREAFNPQPKILSALVNITHRKTLTAGQIDLIKKLFSQRKKILASALKNLNLDSGLIPTGWLSRRVESLSYEEFEKMFPMIPTSGNDMSDSPSA